MHVVTNGRILFFLWLNNILLCLCIHSGWTCTLSPYPATVNNASMNTRAHYAMLVYTSFHRNALLSGAEGNMNYVFFNLSFLWQFQLHECRCFVLLEKLLAHRGHKINICCWLSSLLFWEAALSSGYLEIFMIPLEGYGLVSHRDDVQTLWLLDIPTLIPDFVLWDEKNNIF